MRYTFAPLEGVTGYVYRNLHRRWFGGVERYYMPFISVGQSRSFSPREWQDFCPEHNESGDLVPQLLGKDAEGFIWAARELRALGYREINFNLGCPSGTVTGKNKGAGLLRQPELLRQLLDGIFDALPDMKISVKTRIGWERAEEWPALLALLETYPICRLTVHPRVRTQFYKGAADREVFRWTAEHTALPLCYNGDVTTVRDLREMGETFPDAAIMVGRGLVADPSLLRQAAGGPAASLEELREFHDRLYGLYCRDFSGDVPVLHHMRELWNYFSRSFRETDTLLRQVRKAGDCRAYETAVRQFFYDAELSH